MKYLYINDVSYLIRKQGKILIPLLLFPVIVMLINVTVSMPVVDHLNGCMGTNLVDKIAELNLVEALMFLFNMFSYIFLIAEVYVKDISYQLDNIFLRMKPLNWITKKNIVFIILTTLIKIFQYVLLLITLFIFKKSNIFSIPVFSLITKDLVYTIFIQFLFISIYVTSSLIKKNKVIPYIIFCSILVFIPKNIYKLNFNEVIFLSIIIIILLVILQIIFKKYNKKIIEYI